MFKKLLCKWLGHKDSRLHGDKILQWCIGDILKDMPNICSRCKEQIK